MAKLVITIELDNDIFAEDPLNEIENVLHAWLDKAKERGFAKAAPYTLREGNGNTCGEVLYKSR